MWPIPIICKFIFGQTPLTYRSSYIFRDTGIIAHVIEKAFLIVFMVSNNLFSSFITGLRVIVAFPDIIAAYRSMIIRFRFLIRNGIKFFKLLSPSRFKYPSHQLVPGRIIILWFGKWQPVILMVCHTNPETICLYSVISLAFYPGIF